jgi:hypothetical protein
MSIAIVTGKITAASGEITLPNGERGYTTASVSYTILATIEGAMAPVEFAGQRPEIRIWPQDQEINVAEIINRTCIGVKVGDDIRWHFFEPPVVANCEPTAPLPLTDQQREEELIRLASIVGGGGAGGASATPGPGGEV